MTTVNYTKSWYVGHDYDSEWVDGVYLNENTNTVVFDLDDKVYSYTHPDINEEAVRQVVEAGSVGAAYNDLFKNADTYGDGNHLGGWWDIQFDLVEKVVPDTVANDWQAAPVQNVFVSVQDDQGNVREDIPVRRLATEAVTGERVVRLSSADVVTNENSLSEIPVEQPVEENNTPESYGVSTNEHDLSEIDVFDEVEDEVEENSDGVLVVHFTLNGKKGKYVAVDAVDHWEAIHELQHAAAVFSADLEIRKVVLKF